MYRFTSFGGPINQRPVEDLAFAVARFIQKGGSLVNYYMVSPSFIFFAKLFGLGLKRRVQRVILWWFQYHGGTNFGRTAGGPFITTSYDYDAPIDEYGEQFRDVITSEFFSSSQVLRCNSWLS